MKKTLGLALVGGLMALGMGSGQAQSTNTFTLQSLNIALSGVSAGGTNGNATSEQINNKRLISVLTSALNLSSNLNKGKLQLANNTSDNSTAFLITSGSGRSVTAVDVTPFFSHTTLAGPLTKGKTSNSIDLFTFGMSGDTNTPTTSLSFAVQGFTTGNGSSFNSTVNGPGSDNGADAVLKGTISAGAPSKAVTVSISNGAITVSTNSTSTNSP